VIILRDNPSAYVGPGRRSRRRDQYQAAALWHR